MPVSRENTKDRSDEFKVPAGELIDQLSICNCKMWHVDEGISNAEKRGDYAEAGKLAVMARELNSRRADYREELNRRLDGEGAGTNKIQYCKDVESR